MARTIFMLFLIIILGLISGSAFYLNRALTTPYSSDNSKKTFTFEKGSSSSQVAQKLRQENLIRSPLAFRIYLKIRSWQLIPGRYSLQASMTIPQIAGKLSSGEVEETKVTFIEGWRLTQMADKLQEKGLVKKDDFLKAAEGQEGYLFPDTYNFAMNTSADEIIKTMRTNFTRRTADLKITPETVILASIVEREAQKDEDRPIVAGVYANRLKTGMRLEADPTIQYAKGSWESITVSDYQNTQSPYNTYLHAGLPPGPICNPGLKSIQAAANPTPSEYFYFFHTKDGKTIYSKTLDEHNANKKKYL